MRKKHKKCGVRPQNLCFLTKKFLDQRPSKKIVFGKP
jgi:hypothetical protein